MKRVVISIAVLALLALIFPTGCGAAKTREEKGAEGATSEGEAAAAERKAGLDQGYKDGYRQGYADGEKGVREPEPQNRPEGSDDYIAGYMEGYPKGYEDGQADAQAASKGGTKPGDGDELAKVEAAMISFVKANAAPGLEFRIDNIVIHGDEAAGIAVCTSERLENALVIMKKGSSGWYGVDFGTGIEPPSWYSYY